MKAKDFKAGDRVAIHPACDCWMQGDRFGDVVNTGTKSVKVRCDRSGRVRKFSPVNLENINAVDDLTI